MRYTYLILFIFCLHACKEIDPSTRGPSSVVDPVTNDSTTGSSNPDPPDNSEDQDQITNEFLTLINNHRIDIGLDPLIHHEGLKAIAFEHSQNMALKIVPFGHLGFSDRCSAGRTVVGGGNLCSENVAMGQKNAQAAFDAWMNSSGHRANIEQGRVTHTGFGYHKSSSGAYYWTQIFIEKN